MEKHLIVMEEMDLKNMLRDLIRNELKAFKPEQPAAEPVVAGFSQTPILKGEQVCKMLHISRQTLHAWVKEGLIRSYKVKSRLFFLRQDVDNLMRKPDG